MTPSDTPDPRTEEGAADRPARVPRQRAPAGSLERFAKHLHPAVLADMQAWAGHPTLDKLHANLNHHLKLRGFLDTCAEAIVARHLLDRGCGLAFEVPTPHGKACDFEVTAGDRRFYLHVKRVDTDRPVGRRLTISSRLRSLERLARPYVVSVRWRETASDEQMQRLVLSATDFINHARVGDELVVHDEDGTEIGGVLIVAPGDGPHVSLVIGLPSGFIDEVPRMCRQLRRAYRQFMPRADNVILICSSQAEDEEDFAAALLGAHVERWDAFPPRGRRIAHGRAEDGLWHAGRYADSRAAGWFRLAPGDDTLRTRFWFRSEPAADPDLEHTLTHLFRHGG